MYPIQGEPQQTLSARQGIASNRPVVIIDTPGFDDEGALGELRVRKTRQILNKSDVAVLVADCTEGLKDCDRELIEIFRSEGDSMAACLE